jgi:hypothetical protein
MNSLGPFILLLIAVLVATFIVLIAALVFLLGRKLVTGRPAGTSRLLYLLIAPVMIIALEGFYFYAASKGIAEHTVIKWMNILIASVFVFGLAVRKFWVLHKKWTFWAALGVLIVGHFALLSRLRWQQAGYFWLIVVIGIPELALVFFLLGLVFKPKEPRTANEVADIIERFLTGNSSYPQEWNDFVECREPDSQLDTYRKKCNELDPLVNCPDPQDAGAIAELRGMIAELRRLQMRNEGRSFTGPD